MTATIEGFLAQLFLSFFSPLWLFAQILEPKAKCASRPTKRAARSTGRKLLFRPELLEMFHVSSPTIWLWMQRRGFPRPIVVVGRDAWFADEVQAWIESRPRRRIKGDPPVPPQADTEGGAA
jgi:predicted DNA-binding transcriptional regulator AlpA